MRILPTKLAKGALAPAGLGFGPAAPDILVSIMLTAHRSFVRDGPAPVSAPIFKDDEARPVFYGFALRPGFAAISGIANMPMGLAQDHAAYLAVRQALVIVDDIIDGRGVVRADEECRRDNNGGKNCVSKS